MHTISECLAHLHLGRAASLQTLPCLLVSEKVEFRPTPASLRRQYGLHGRRPEKGSPSMTALVVIGNSGGYFPWRSR